MRVFGEDRWNVSELRSQLGIVSADSISASSRATARAALRGGGRSLRVPVSHGILRYGEVTDDMRSRAAEALDAVGATHLARRTLDQMSSGRRARNARPRAGDLAPSARAR